MDEIKKDHLNNESENREGLNIAEEVLQEDITLQETEQSDAVKYESVEYQNGDPEESQENIQPDDLLTETIINPTQNDVSHIKEKKKGKRRLFKVASFVLLFTFLGGSLFGGGYITALYLGDSLLTNAIQVRQAEMIDDGNVIQINQLTPVSNSLGTSDVSAPVVISKEVGPSVVTVISTMNSKSANPFNNSTYSQEGSGSGIIFKVDQDNLYVVTNHHVIDGATKVEVTLKAGDTYAATVLGFDSDMDVAVLAIDINDIDKSVASKIAIASFGNSDDLQVGETAVAIGSPLGIQFSNSVTVGVISAIDRIISVEDSDLKLIQTDAAINPGNSGGALVNSKGEIIGINTAKYIDTDVEGMGFAIPINTAEPIINKILEKKDGSDLAVTKELPTDRAFLGIGVSDITQEIYSQTGMPFGAYINQIFEGSGAEKAGLKVGDVVFAINDEKVLSAADLVQKISSYKIGETVKLTVARDNKMIEIKAELLKYSDVVK